MGCDEKSATKIVKKSDQNHFPTSKRLVIAGRRCKADVVTDMTLFRPRKQGNGKSAKNISGEISKKLNFVHL